MARTRVKSTGQATSTWQYYHYEKGVYDYRPTERNITGQSLGPLKSETMNDTPTPGFKAKLARGEIVNNAMKQTIEEIHERIAPIYINYETPMWRYYTVGTIGTRHFLNSDLPNLQIDSIDIESLTADTLQRARAGVGQSDASLLVTIGEIKETVNMLRSIFTRLSRYISHNKRLHNDLLRNDTISLTSPTAARADRKAISDRDRAYYKRSLKGRNLSNEWLEYRYGIRPFVSDICNLLRAFEKRQVNRRQTSRSYGAARKKNSGECRDTQALVPCTLSVLKEREVVVRAGVLYLVDPIYTQSLFHKLGLDKPIEAAWDLIPFSFIVDWFFNIGAAISAWTPDIGVQSLAQWVVVEDKTTYSLAVTDVTPNAGFSCTVGKLGHDDITTVVTRTPMAPGSAIPRFRVNMDWARAIDLSLILGQIARGK